MKQNVPPALTVLILVVVLAAIGFVGYYLFLTPKARPSTTNMTPPSGFQSKMPKGYTTPPPGGPAGPDARSSAGQPR
jgi:hypothetical protein